MAGTQVFFQFPAHHNAVHHRHHDITDYNIRNAAQCLFQPLFTIGGSPHFKIVRERFYNIITDVPIIFHYQQNTLTTMHRFYLFFFFVLFIGSFLRRVSMQHMGIRVIRQQTDIKVPPTFKELSTLISPSCKTTRFFTRARPIPVPEA